MWRRSDHGRHNVQNRFQILWAAAFCISQNVNENNYHIKYSSPKETDHLKMKTHFVPNLCYCCSHVKNALRIFMLRLVHMIISVRPQNPTKKKKKAPAVYMTCALHSKSSGAI